MKHATDITIILDRSGSMEAIKSDVIGGFNQFVADQRREPGECRLTLVQFDDRYEVVYSDQAVAKAPRLTADTFQPRGSTALLDAIGRTIDTTGARLRALAESERPDQVVVAILTDGLENASTKYTRERVFDMIDTQRAVYRWTFLFLAANQDAIAEGNKFGIPPRQSFTFQATGQGVRAGTRALSRAVSSFRSKGDAQFTDEDRSQAGTSSSPGGHGRVH